MGMEHSKLGMESELSLTCMKLVMTFDLACGVFSSRISVGTSRASRLKDRTIAITLGASSSFWTLQKISCLLFYRTKSLLPITNFSHVTSIRVWTL